LKYDIVKLEEDAPSAKAKDDIARISNLLIKSTVFNEAFRFERFGIEIDFLVTSHAPVSAVWVSTYLEDTRELTIN
jgi:hypothetical protein